VAPTVTSRTRLDAHQVKPPPGVSAFTVIVQYGSQPSQHIDVRTMATCRGGYRLDFWCPQCGRAHRFLYDDHRGFRCRRCAGLRYPSSQMHHDQAAKPTVDRKLAAIAERLHTTVEARSYTTPTRPAGMHRSTYERLLSEWRQLKDLDNALWLNRFYGPLGSAMYESIGLDRDEVRPALAVANQVRRWREERRQGQKV
jgi:hypothetical protein